MSRSALLMPLSIVVMAGGLVGFFLTPEQLTVRFISFILTFLVVGVTAWSISDRRGPDPLDIRSVDAAVIGLAFMVGSVLILGTIGLLDWWMLVATAGMAASMWAIIDRRASFTPRRSTSSQLQLSVVSVFAIGLATFAVVQAVLGRIFRPPVGDPLAYHLPFAVEWLQRGTLAMPIPAAGDPSPPFYPLNSSVWIYWLLAPFESEILARFVQLPFLVLLGLGVYRLGRELNLSSPPATMAAAIAITVPSIARSASMPENDLILAALLVIATAYVVRLGRHFSPWRAGMAAAVVGLAIGTKVIALAFGGLLGVVWLILVVQRFRVARLGGTAGLLASGALIVVLLGGYSYLRNSVVMDNPLYPAGYELPGGYVLEGLYFPTWEWRQDHAFFPFDWDDFLFGMRRDFGWTVTAWAIPGFVLASLAAVIGGIFGRRTRRQNRVGVIPVAWVVLSLLIFWYVIPYHFSRFLFPTIAVAIVVGMWGLGRLAALIQRWRIEDWYPLLAVPVVVLNLLNVPLDLTVRERPAYWLAAVLVIGVAAGGLLMARSVPIPRLRFLAQISLIVTGVVAIAGWPVYSDAYDERRIVEWRLQIQGFSRAPDAWQWLERETAGNEAVIAVAGTNEIYPLYGPDLENEVVTIWHSGELALYDWGNPFVLYGIPKQPDWIARIQVVGVDYIVMTENVSFGGWPSERQWMVESPERFERVFANPDIEIWEVLEPPGEVAGYTGPRGWINLFDWRDH